MSTGQYRKDGVYRVAVTTSYPKEALGKHLHDFINGFPKVQDFKSVFVIVDQFSKYVVFVPALEGCPTEELARLFFNNVVKYSDFQNILLVNRMPYLRERSRWNYSSSWVQS